ncbi:MAG TPA: hypothetical protein VF220_10190 [Nitrososphaeraceae archaeon]
MPVLSTTAREKTSESTESTTDDKNSRTGIEDVKVEKASIPTPTPNQSLDENARNNRKRYVNATYLA